MKKEALDRIVRGTRFGSGYGTYVRHTTCSGTTSKCFGLC